MGVEKTQGAKIRNPVQKKKKKSTPIPGELGNSQTFIHFFSEAVWMNPPNSIQIPSAELS